MAKIKKDTSLRKSILQAAITGQLISDVDGETETGKQLLDRIIEERKKMSHGLDFANAKSRKRKSKKETALAGSNPCDIPEEEIPFEIPETWCWCRLGEICNEIKRGKSPKYAEKSDYLAFAQKCNAKTGEIDLGLALYLDEKTIGRYSEEDNLIQGDIVINSTGGGTMGRVGYYETKVPAGIKGVYPDSHVTVIRSIGNLNQKYLYYFLKLNQPILEKCGTGSTNQTELKPAVLSNFFIPLPPLAVQNAIVAKLEEVLPLVDAYENVVLQKEELKNALPDKVKKAILQEAIQGKLTESWRKSQRLLSEVEATETGKQLLDRIIEERNAKLLVEWEEAKKKNPKAKKPTPIVASEIAEEEIPFEIPENWCWCRLGDLAFIARGGSPRPITEYLTNDSDGYNWIKISDTDKGGKYINSTKQRIKKEGLYKTRLIRKGDFLLTNSMSFGRPYISNIEGCIHDGWLVFSFPNNCIISDFIYYLLSSSFIYKQFADSAAGAVVQNLNTDKVIETIIPLPSLAEQKKIVEIIEQILPLCEKLGG